MDQKQAGGKDMYRELVEQVSSINERLGRRELKNEKYRKFFGSVAESLELLGLEPGRAEVKEVWRLWKAVVQYLISQKFELPK